MMSEVIYLYRLKGLEKYSSCTKQRYLDYKLKDYLYEVKVVYSAPERKPLPIELIDKELERQHKEGLYNKLESFYHGVLFAERYHGILGDEEWKRVSKYL